MNKATKALRAPRALLRRIETYRLWVRQGRPLLGPVVIRPGRLVDRDGQRTITLWSLDTRHMVRPLTTDGLWEFLSFRYPHLVETSR